MFPTVTLFLLAGIIAVRLVIRGFSEMRIARRAHGPSLLLAWAYSGLFVLLSLLLLLPLLAITLLVVFLVGTRSIECSSVVSQLRSSVHDL